MLDVVSALQVFLAAERQLLAGGGIAMLPALAANTRGADFTVERAACGRRIWGRVYSVGLEKLSLLRKLRVAMFVTGDSLVDNPPRQTVAIGDTLRFLLFAALT